jgi:hypothetical protein
MKRSSHQWWISIGVTVVLAVLLALAGVALAQDSTPGEPAPDVAEPAAPEGGPSETMAFSYQGRLVEGGSPANGNYDFIINLYDNPTAGAPVAGCMNAGTGSLLSQPVTSGIFTFHLVCGASNSSVFTGGSRWIEVQVRRTGALAYVKLPRQPISPAPYTFSLYPGAVVEGMAVGSNFGDSVLNVASSSTVATRSAFHAKTASGYAVRGDSPSGAALYGYSTSGYSIYGSTNSGTSARFYSNAGNGLDVQTSGTRHYDHAGIFTAVGGNAVLARSTNNVAVRAESGNIAGLSQPGGSVGVAGIGQRGVYGSGSLFGVYGTTSSNTGYGGAFANSGSDGAALYAGGMGAGRSKAAMVVENLETAGGMAAYLVNQSNYHNAHFYNSSSGGVLYLQNGGTDGAGAGGGDFITALNKPENDTQFRVLSSGEVRSDVGFGTPAADFAEMLPAVGGLEPGDVLIAGPDGKLARSTQPNQTSVVGVHSTQPGFVGGRPVAGDPPGHVPLAVVGVVPVKASAENGPIAPGDLLTTSSTAGRAMKAGANPAVGTVIGKALGSLAEGDGVIQMLVTLQ